MTTINQQYDTLAGEMRSLVETIQREKRQPTADETRKMDENLPKLKQMKLDIEASQRSAVTLAELRAATSSGSKSASSEDDPDGPALTLGRHFVKCAKTRLQQAKGQSGTTIGVPEFLSVLRKAAADTHLVGTNPGDSLNQVDTSVVSAYRQQPVVADLLGSGTLSGTSLTYYIEGAAEGAFTTLAEGGLKPQLHYVYDVVTDSLTKIAGRIKLSDEMIEDLAFLVSEIDQRLLYDLSIVEEQQLLNGNGTAPNLRGLLNRVGIQTETSASAAGNADSIFKAMTKIQTATGFAADGLVIHPTNYQTLRLAKDSNAQYYGGGFFSGAYGVGGVVITPPIWGLRTIVTSAIAVNTALVGAFAQSATVYRKGGVRVESTNSNVDDFEHNLVTIRAEERLALAVRKPLALCKVTLSVV